MFEKVCVVGLGYIGLPTASVLASRKLKVIGLDVKQSIIDTVNEGKIHIVEPDLDLLVSSVVSEGYLRATLKAEKADAFIIAVPTPFKDDNEPDTQYIHDAAKSIAPVLEKGNLIILESTSPVGTTDQLCKWLEALRPDLSFPLQDKEDADILVAYCPERVLPGKVLSELFENDRIIGGMDQTSSKAAETLYKTFLLGDVIHTNARTAEMTKLTENSFRDVNIAYANELSMICDDLDINVWELIRLANRHPRVNILNPGPGVGGHCIAVDPWFIVSNSPKHAKLIKQAREVNDYKPHYVLKYIEKALIAYTEKNGRKPKVACYGLAFKPNIDDLRESAALEIVKQIPSELIDDLYVVEPNITKPPKDLQHISLISPQDAFKTADINILLVAHLQFEDMDWVSLTLDRVLDFCGVCQP